jgi:hypothetical protein
MSGSFKASLVIHLKASLYYTVSRVDIATGVRGGVTGMRVVTFKVDEELLERLDSFARLKGVPRSEVIRRAIELYLRLEEKKQTIQPRIVKLYS